jgi:TonB family protein
MRTNYLLIATVGALSVGSLPSQEVSHQATAASIPQLPQATGSDSDVALGKPIQWDSPKYPKHALKSNMQGEVVLRLTVGKDGRVTRTEAVSGNPELADSAIHAAHKWLYIPYFRDAKAVEAQTMVTINFKVAGDGRPDISATYKMPSVPSVGRIFKPGDDGVSAPKVVVAPDPGYSEEARQDKYQGVCVLELVVGPDGRPYDIKVTKALGKGLDEKAVEAVQQWRFRPAVKDGQPVSVAIDVEVQFRLY